MANLEDVVIIGALRTAIGSLNGALSSLKAHELGAEVIKVLVASTQLNPEDVSEVILGQVFTAGQGQNPARQAAIHAGLPVTVPATSVNVLCGSGLKSVAMGYQAIKCGDATVVVAGGQESMSQAVHCVHMRNPLKFGDAKLIDTMIEDGLKDAFHGCHMGVTAENVAREFHVSRSDQDEFAFQSQLKTAEAQRASGFASEIVPVTVKQRKETLLVDQDEFPKNDTTVDALKKLRTPFSTDTSATVTAGNASGVNDGAAALLLMSATAARHHGNQPMARIASWAQVGVDPLLMGIGPIGAVRAAVSKAGWQLADVDVIEINEAFAAQSLAVVRELGIDAAKDGLLRRWTFSSPDYTLALTFKVNMNGGAIALGHPLGASGARILVTLLHVMRLRKLRKGVAALCVGGGMGMAMCVERLP